MSAITTMDKYSPIGDIITISLCWVLLILVFCSYVRKTRSFHLFLFIIATLMTAAYSSIVYRMLMDRWQAAYTVPIYIARFVMHAAMFLVMHFFALYIAEAARLSRQEKRFTAVISGILLGVLSLYELIGILTGAGFRIDGDGSAHTGFSAFSIGYLAFVLVNAALLIHIRDRLYKWIMTGFFLTVILAVGLNLIQRINGQSSFTVATFFFPILPMLYFMHSNFYDSQMGTVDRIAVDEFVRNAHMKHQAFGYMSLFLPDFSSANAVLPEEMKTSVRKVASSAFRSSVLFSVGPGHFLMTFPLRKNPDTDERVHAMLETFQKECDQYHLDYKIVIGRSAENRAERVDYINFIRNIHHSMKMNTVHTVDSKDSSAYDRYSCILSNLEDIYSRHDPDDPRVLVYCQPVYNLALKRYDTAEALMRLKLEEIGLVFPDEFIHLAEELGYIHVLTEIILNKTCREIYRLTQEGFIFSRISVNVAAQELKENAFCDDIMRIIEQNSISGSRIALELTESENVGDFIVTRKKISELKNFGVQFYLDDFGTGYSSMERIMQLPFDIIKFDRSLVSASASYDKAEAMVKNMAQLFKDLNYSILYEGIENEADEERCCGMSASYLQGNKYSRPVPISEINGFFTKD